MRTEKDSLGEVQIADEALWGAQTQRAVENFPISGQPLPGAFVHAVAAIKHSAARANAAVEALPEDIAQAITEACSRILEGEYADQFPVDVYQTGSGTSTNMNVNEVVARLASERAGREVHPNDHVNQSQSSNDVIPTAILVSAVLQSQSTLLPAVQGLIDTIHAKARACEHITKTGRTHLMDAVPVTLGQEMNAWASQLSAALVAVQSAVDECRSLPQGGTAVGTGLNAHPDFAEQFVAFLNELTDERFREAEDKFAGIASQDSAVRLAGALKALAVALIKISNDLRWMNSGPLAGIGEITLPALQPGSSIMPGKVNPVVCESAIMAATQVLANDQAITLCGQAGNFQLNVMLPLVATRLLESIELLANTAQNLASRGVADMEINQDVIEERLARNPVLVTALNPVIGYDAAAKIAKLAYAQQRPVIDVAEEETDLDRETLERLLDPASLTRPQE